VTPLAFVIICLAAARLTRLVTEDIITEPLREWASIKPAWVYDLITCPWCIGFWISLGCVAVWWTSGDRAVWLLAPFAVSYVAGWVNSR
jgi:hypothetical protein